MKPIMLICFSYLSLGFAQATCESLLADLEQTLAQTQSLERTTTIKLGFIEVASMTELLNQTSSGLEATEIERSGRELPNRPEGSEPLGAGWLGPFDPGALSCKGHSLKPLSGNRFELTLSEDDANPSQTFDLLFEPENEHLVLTRVKSKMQAPDLPISPDVTLTLRKWTFVQTE